jgi:hypothetical protein
MVRHEAAEALGAIGDAASRDTIFKSVSRACPPIGGCKL